MKKGDIARAIGTAIRKRRAALGLSQRRLSIMVGCNYSMVCHIERGSRLPSIEALARLADALGTSMRALVP